MVFQPELVQRLNALEAEIRRGQVSEHSRAWLAGCGLTVEQMEEEYVPARKLHLYHCDHRGLPLALIDTDNIAVWHAEYDEWENLLYEDNPQNLQQLIRLPGQQYDDESGLYYNRHRYYEPQQERYITQDPIGLEGGWNLYQYPLNPVLRIDPLGLVNQLFDTKDSAAIYALKMCNGSSIAENSEYGGLICKTHNEKYYFTNALKGGASGVNPYKSPCDKNSEVVGDYHTHGYYSDINGNITTKSYDVWDSDNFSNADIKGAKLLASKYSEYSIYLDTPSNTIKKYTPAKNTVEILK